MSQIRRVTRSIVIPRSTRPESAAAACSHETATARLATVTHLFPAHAGKAAERTENLFLDLDEDAVTPISRARDRALRLMPDAGICTVSNIFAEHCPDLSETAEAEMQARVAARPRKMALARAEIMAAHEERAAARHPFASHDLPRVAAGIAAVIAVLSILQLPHA